MAFSGSNILNINYDSFERKLDVYFLGGGRYHFFDVPNTIYEELLLSKNKSEVFNEKIKDIYEYKKIH